MSPIDPACVFCRIAAGEIPAAVVARSDHAMAFQDLTPKAPIHVLVIPTTHVGVHRRRSRVRPGRCCWAGSWPWRSKRRPSWGWRAMATVW